jgi:hypothetical protein
MAKRKKKPSQYQHDKLTEARRRNEFLYKINYLITALTGDPSVFKLIPQSEYRNLFILRFRIPRVSMAEGSTMPQHVFDMVKQYLISKLKTTTVLYTSGGPKITLDMLFTIGLSLFYYLDRIEDDRFPSAKALKKALEVVTADLNEEHDTEVLGELFARLDKANDTVNLLNEFDNQIYWLDLESNVNDAPDYAIYYEYKINSYCPKQIHIVVDGIARPVYELCWGDRHEGLRKIIFYPEQLGLTAKDDAEPIPVYIQPHAINRMYERLDCVNSLLFWRSVLTSLAELKWSHGPHNTFLFDFRIYRKKVGYLVVRLQLGVALVQTFLLTTHNGTPEGNRLASLTKLNKLDIQYLTIDKLSTFYASDIAANLEVKKLFIDAGCAELFDLDPIFLHKGTTDQKKPLAEKILNYLNLTTSDDSMETYRKEQMPG